MTVGLTGQKQPLSTGSHRSPTNDGGKETLREGLAPRVISVDLALGTLSTAS
jgi:hypothetical protein